MAGMWLLSVVVVLSLNTAWSRPQTGPGYAGFKVLQIKSDDKDAFVSVVEEISRDYNLDFWTKRATYAEVMVGPQDFDDVVRKVLNGGLTTSVTVNDVHKLLEKDFQDRQQSRAQSVAEPDVTSSYLTHTQINDYLARVSSTATTADVTVGDMGQTFEGRQVKYVTIQEKNTGGSRKEKFTIAIDAGIHAREWISISMALNIIKKLSFNPDNDPDVAEMLSKFDWVIAPCVNPDGYDYSHRGTNERIWRKSRTTAYVHLASNGCNGIGVDLNRNFGFDWNPAAGGSTNPCSDVFSGGAGFSEPETKNVRQWLLPIKQKTKLYLNLHAYGEFMLYPYGSNPNRYREEEELLISAGQAFANAVAAGGRRYSVGNSAEVFYIAAGGADDFAKGDLGISLSYTPELSPHDDDVKGHWRNGFVLPETKIQPIADTTWPGFKAMARRVFELYGFPAK